MRSSRLFALGIMIVAFVFNEWAFRFIFPLEPIDSFLRLMTLVLDGFVLVFVSAFVIDSVKFSERLKTLLSNYPKTVSIYLGLFVGFCMIMAVEFSCRYYFKHVYEAPYSEATYWEPGAVARDSILGSALPKDTVISHAYVINDSLIYKQYYKTDEFGRRFSMPAYADSLYGEFVMVTGCSFAFGYGLHERETLGFYLDSLTGKRAYNYAVAGYGTQQTLAVLQSRDLGDEIAEKNGVLIHLFIDDHIPRLIGSRRLMKLWAQNFPYYYLEADSLVRDGSFWTGRHILTRFYRAISQSAFIDLFDIDFPWYVSDKHMQLFGAVLEGSKRLFIENYPNGKFLVVIGPNSKLAARVMEELESRNLDVLDLSELLDKEEKKYKIHWTEAHPNRQYYLEVAKEISEHLKN